MAPQVQPAVVAGVIHGVARTFWLIVHLGFTFVLCYEPLVSHNTKLAHCVLLVTTTFAFLALNTRRPVYARPIPASLSDLGEVETCVRCNALQDHPETKHCKFCDRCVPGWDHHCVFAGGCISRTNQATFWWYLLAQFVTVLPSIHATVSCVGAKEAHYPTFWIFSSVFLGLAFIVLGGFLAFHTLMVGTLQTTYVLKSRWYKREWARQSRVHFTCSQILYNFYQVLLSREDRLQFRVAANGFETKDTRGALRHRRNVWTALARALDAVCDNRFYSCC